MYCDQRSAIDPSATISKPPTSLAALPLSSDVDFPGLFAWSPISTSTLTAALNLDRGLWATWRSRRLTPPPLPETWFRRTTGQPRIYLVSDVLAWLASRRGEPFDHLAAWRLSLLTGFENDVSDPADVKKLVHLYARAAGPIVGDVTFARDGWRYYLDSLLALAD